MARQTGEKMIAPNKNARRLYEFLDTLEAGLALMGSEVKQLRQNRVSFKDSYVDFQNGEAWIIGLHIPPYENAVHTGHEAERKRKLLLHSREINAWDAKVHEKGLTVIPVRLYFRNGKVKLEIALGRGKKVHDRREDLKERDQRREMERALLDR